MRSTFTVREVQNSLIDADVVDELKLLLYDGVSMVCRINSALGFASMQKSRRPTPEYEFTRASERNLGPYHHKLLDQSTSRHT